MKPAKPYITELTWEDCKDEIMQSCPQFAEIVEEISPNNDLPLIKVKYPFGAEIVKNGIGALPTQRGEILPITDTRLPEKMRKQLGYSLVPLGLVTKNHVEVYKELSNTIFSISFWGQGLQLGVWEYFDWTTPYSVSAGARSLYLLPKVTLSGGHKRLKRDYHVTLPPPKLMKDHWPIFKQIVNSPAFTEEWDCEIIYLTDKWLEKLESNGPWLRLRNYLLERGWLHSEYARKKSIFDVIWQLFAKSLSERGLKPNPYVLDTLKHLAFIGTGVLPASRPANGSGSAGPIDGIQQVYLDCYGLKDYIPTIMEPANLSLLEKNSVYYSLQSPSMLESIPQLRNLSSIIDNMRELKELTDHFLGEAFDENLRVGQTKVINIIQKLSFEFFHEATYAYGADIRPTYEMPEGDSNLLYLPPGSYGQRKFPETSAFLRGCVRVSMTNSSA